MSERNVTVSIHVLDNSNCNHFCQYRNGKHCFLRSYSKPDLLKNDEFFTKRTEYCLSAEQGKDSK